MITPIDRPLVITCNGVLTVMLRFAVVPCAEGVSESVTLTVKFAVPLVVGVPEICPLLFMLKPEGRLPAAILQMYGVTPPVAASV